MATIIAKNQYKEYDGKAKINAEKLFVEINMGSPSVLTLVPITDLYFKTKKGIPLKIKSYSDFVKNFKNDNVYNSSSCIQKINYDLLSREVPVQFKAFEIPNDYDSISENKINASEQEKVPYGLKRNLKVEEASAAVSNEDRYLLARVNGKNDFIKLSNMYFYDDNNTKLYLNEYKGSISALSDVTLYNHKGEMIESLYITKQYVLSKVNAREKFNPVTFEKETYAKLTKKSGNDTVVQFKTKKEKIEAYYAEQKFVTKEVDDEKHLGKTKKISLIETKNYKANPEGEYVNILINKTKTMVKLTDLVDEAGNEIADIKTMVGKIVKVKHGEEIVAESEPLTYEQANLYYDSVLMWQKTKDGPNENTYIALTNGEKVKELEVAKPISYKKVVGKNAAYDAFLVKTTNADGSEKFVVVSSDYFKKHGDGEYKQENAIKIKRCNFDDVECSVVQTTSKGNEIEQCQVVKKISGFKEDVDERVKENELEGFKGLYLTGNYAIDGVFHKGKFDKTDGNRYKETDTLYLNDYANELIQYKSLNAKNLSIKDGKLVGGAKYDIKKAILSAYGVWWEALYKGIGISFAAGIFIPVVGPIMSAAYSVAILAAIPAIPIVNLGIGLVKSIQRKKFKNKEKYNAKQEKKQIKKELELLHERMTDKNRIHLSEAEFQAKYEGLVGRILSLSNRTTKKSISLINGELIVDANNANEANSYRKDYNKLTKKLNKSNISLEESKKAFEKYKNKMAVLTDDGRILKSRQQKKLNLLEQNYKKELNVNNDINHKKKMLINKNGILTETKTSKDRDKLLEMAKDLKTNVYIKCFADKKFVKEELETLTDKEKKAIEKLKYHKEKGITLQGKDLSKEHNVSEEWKNVQKAFKNIKENTRVVEEKDSNSHKMSKRPIVENVDDVLTPDDTLVENDIHTVDPVITPEEPKKEPKTRLSAKNLEKLLKTVEELEKFDALYFGADEEVPGDIETTIAKLEQQIEKDKHLLSGAMKSKTNKYHIYKERIIDAEKVIKKHKISNYNRNDIKITV